MAGRSRRIALATAAMAGIVLAAIYWDYRGEIQAERARIASGSQIANTPCGPIEYAVAGSGPPVLLIHGAGGGFDQGLELARPLVDNGFRVIAMSRFGYLRTPLPEDASPEAQADAHACLLNALNLDRVAVVGGSAGASSAMQLCLRHPKRCLAMGLLFPIAFAPGTASTQPPRLFLFVVKTTLHSDFLYWVATKMARDTLFKTILATPPDDFRNAPEEEQRRALEIMRHILPISQREKGIWNDATISASIPRYDLEKFRVPTIVISAEDDLYGTYSRGRYTAEQISGARFVGYATGGHLLLGHWKETSVELSQFLRQTGTRNN
jgi:2-hydroxy-6-oxonona-2,4-dienedioate hydrolase